jgi:hypothetical protein
MSKGKSIILGFGSLRACLEIPTKTRILSGSLSMSDLHVRIVWDANPIQVT